MIFTREDILKILNALLQLGRKDSEFKNANTPLNDNDEIVILQDGINKKVSINNLLSTLGLLKKDDFINVSDRYDEYYIHLSEAITIIANNKRKKGLVITFLDIDGNWRIYLFIGELSNFIITDYWKDLHDFKYPVINSVLPDEEDLTLTYPNIEGNSFIKLKDKEYNLNDFSGLGHIILRKNLVEVMDPLTGKSRDIVNLLYQDMIKKENTIYEIKYDFDLNRQTVTIPTNCILQFSGGSINNGQIVFTNTLLQGDIKAYCRVSGTLQNNLVLPTWFISLEAEDCTNAILDSIDIVSLTANIHSNVVYLPTRTYNIYKPLNIYRAKLGRKNIEFYGDLNTIIKAMADMPYMITTADVGSGNYISSYFHNFILDGNRYIGTFGITDYTSKCYAKGGIYFPSGFIYTLMHNIVIRDVDGWAFDISETYRINFTELTVFTSFGGMFLNGNVNGISYTHNEMSQIKHIGLCAHASHEMSIHDNVFENMGGCGILMGGGSAPCSIRDNYFEACSTLGFKFITYNKEEFSARAEIMVIGTVSGAFHEKNALYDLVKDSLTHVIVEGNDFQTGAAEVCVLCNNLTNSKICNNTINNSETHVIGTLLDSNSCKVLDVEITGNIYFQRYPIASGYAPKIKIFYTRDINNASLYNIYSKDTPSNSLYSTNLINISHIATYGSKHLVETTEEYNGIKVFLAKNENIVIGISNSYEDSGPIIYYDNSILTGKIIEVEYYVFSGNSWTRTLLNMQNSASFLINLKANEKITVPTIKVIGERYEGNSRYTPIYKVNSYRVNSAYGICFLPTTIVKIIGNPLVMSYTKTYDNNGNPTGIIVNDTIKSIPNASMYHDLFTYFKSEYNGLIVFNEALLKVVRWNGEKWTTLDGVDV